MTMRLAGEDVGAVQGLDGQGWLREVRAADVSPGLRVNQTSTGRVFDFQDGGVSAWYLPDGGTAVLDVPLDVRKPLKNTGAENGGYVAIEDRLYVADSVVVRDTLAGTDYVGVAGQSIPGYRGTVYLRERASHMVDSDVAEDYGYIYVLNDGANYQFVIKLKVGGVVKTATVNLA